MHRPHGGIGTSLARELNRMTGLCRAPTLALFGIGALQPCWGRDGGSKMCWPSREKELGITAAFQRTWSNGYGAHSL